MTQNLALNQQFLELDLFHFGLAKFTVQDFEDVQIFRADRFLIQFLADQKVSHATLLSNMIGGGVTSSPSLNSIEA